MTPFHVQCQTCQAFLRVTKPEAIGLILACPKCNGMVGVQPPPDWQDTTSEASELQPHTASATPATAKPPVLREPVTARRLVMPSVAAGGLLCAGLLSWLIWSQLRPPDHAEPLPSVAAFEPNPAAEKSPSVDESVNPAAQSAEQAKKVNEQQIAVPQPAQNDPAAVVANPQAPTEDIPVPVVEQPPSPTEQSPLAPAPPKPKLVLKPELTPPAHPEPPLFARGPEGDPNAATQAKPAAAIEEQPVFNTPSAVPPETAKVVPPQPATEPLVRTPLAAVDPKRLELSLAAVSYDNVPLHAFLREMSELVDTEIGVDDETLARSGWRLTTPIRVQLQNVTARGVLQSALRPLELDLVVKENYLWIGHATPAATDYITRYPIDDLVSKDSPDTDATELAAQLQRLVAPDHWATGKLNITAGAFLITQAAPVHDELIVWFEKLRIARGLPLRTKYDPTNAQLRRFAPARFALATRWQLAEPLLARPVTASFQQPETLREILDVFRRQTPAVLLWDLPALDAAGLSPETLATLVVREHPLGLSLEQLLTPLGLTAIPLDDTSLLLTTKSVAAQRRITERYSLGHLAEQRRWGTDEAGVTAGFRQEIAARGIEMPETVPLAWDAASRTLAVNASPATHHAIEKVLAELTLKPVAATAVIKK